MRTCAFTFLGLIALGLFAGTGRAETLWPSCGNGSLVSDNKAYRIGDIITIDVEEESELSHSIESSNSKVTDTEGKFETLNAGGESEGITGHPPEVAFDSSKTFDGSGAYSLAGKMQTSIAAVVVEVLPNGNLVIEGSRLRQSVDDTVTVRVSGIVRPVDITATNTIPSSKIAQAKIVMDSNGPVARSGRQGWLTYIVDIIWPF